MQKTSTIFITIMVVWGDSDYDTNQPNLNLSLTDIQLRLILIQKPYTQLTAITSKRYKKLHFLRIRHPYLRNFYSTYPLCKVKQITVNNYAK